MGLLGRLSGSSPTGCSIIGVGVSLICWAARSSSLCCQTIYPTPVATPQSSKANSTESIIIERFLAFCFAVGALCRACLGWRSRSLFVAGAGGGVSEGFRGAEDMEGCSLSQVPCRNLRYLTHSIKLRVYKRRNLL